MLKDPYQIQRIKYTHIHSGKKKEYKQRHRQMCLTICITINLISDRLLIRNQESTLGRHVYTDKYHSAFCLSSKLKRVQIYSFQNVFLAEGHLLVHIIILCSTKMFQYRSVSYIVPFKFYHVKKLKSYHHINNATHFPILIVHSNSRTKNYSPTSCLNTSN